MNSKIFSCINGHPPTESILSYTKWIANQTKLETNLLYCIGKKSNNDIDLTGNLSAGSRENLLKEFVELEHEQNKLNVKIGNLVLEKSKEAIKENKNLTVYTLLRKGKLVDTLCDYKDDIFLTIIGRYGERNLDKKSPAHIGHKVESIIRTLEKPVLVVPSEFSVPNNILLAYDGSEASIKTLKYIIESKLFIKTKVFLVHVGKKLEKLEQELLEAKEQLKFNGTDSEVVFLEGSIDKVLEDFIIDNSIDLITMGAFGHNWIHDLIMGSFTSKMLSMFNMPLLLVR